MKNINTTQPKMPGYVHPNKLPYTKPQTVPKHNKYVIELSKPHPVFNGVQKVRREEIGQMLKKSEQNPQKYEGNYIDIQKYNFRPDVWEINGEILHKCPFEDVDEPDKNVFVKKYYLDKKEEINNKKIQILELQKKAKQKRKEREQKEENAKPKNTRKYSNDMDEQENQYLQKQIAALQKKIDTNDQEHDEDEDNEKDNQDQNNSYDQENEDGNNNNNNNEEEEDEEQQEDEQQQEEEEKDENECQEIDDFGDLNEMKEDDSFEEADISKSFVSQSNKNGKFTSDFANQLDNAFSQMFSSQSTETSKILNKNAKKK